MSTLTEHEPQSGGDRGVHSLPIYRRALELLDYNREKGKLYWKYRSWDRQWSSRYAGNEAGCVGGNGYIYIRVTIDDVLYALLAHRLIWVVEHDKLPDFELDHIDQSPRNNRITNLRDVSASTNVRNVTLRSDNKSGHRGVSMRRGMWRAKATRFGKQIHIGDFYTYEDAVKARQKWEADNL